MIFSGWKVFPRISIFAIFLIILFSTSMNVIYAQELPLEEFPEDVTDPVVTVPSDLIGSATSIFGSTVTFSSSALDDIDEILTTTCTPSSGSVFAIGSTLVTCSATDSAGNTGSASFVITIQDTTSPVITVPEDITIDSTITSGTTITFSASASDDIDGFISTTCLPSSGSVFAIGSTTVICTATDSAGNVGSASFVITVQNMITIIEEELIALQEIAPQEIGNVVQDVSRFVHIANSLFELEKQGMKDLQNEFRENIKNSDSTSRQDLRKAFNSDLSDLRKQLQGFRTQYHDLFAEYRGDVKQLVKEAKGLTVSDKKQLQLLGKTRLQIQSQEVKSNSDIFTQYKTSFGIELIDYKKDLIKLNGLISRAQIPGHNNISDDKLTQWKTKQLELSHSVTALGTVLNNPDIDTKSDLKTIIKQVKDQIKQVEKEQNEKGKNSDKGNGSDKKDSKSQKSSKSSSKSTGKGHGKK